VELPVPRVPVALGGEQARPVRPGHAAAEQKYVRFLAGLENAELVIDRREVGDQPLRMGLGAAFRWRGLIPGRPPVAFWQAVGAVVRVLGFELWQVALALGVAGLVVVELAALSTAAGDSVVVGVGAVAHGWCSSAGRRSGQGKESPQRASSIDLSFREASPRAGANLGARVLSHPASLARN